MNIIEQAAKRLEELRRAGVDIPWAAAGAQEAEVLPQRPGPAAAGLPVAGAGPVAAQPVQPAGAAATAVAPQVQAEAPATAVPQARPDPAPLRPARSDRRSREIKLDLDRLFRQGYLVSESAHSMLADQMRIIKRPLLRNVLNPDGGTARIHRPNLILVTSALPGEGKTFFAMNLALSIAMEVDHSVLLVDADVVRPAVLERCGLPPTRGLMDVLRNPGLDLAEVMLRTNVPKLSLLPAGTQMMQSTELLASAAMERLLDDLATMYSDRIVIFDAPPLLPTTESRVLASRAGQVLMVVQANRTEQASVAQAFAALESCPVVMSVLNRTAAGKPASAYGYGMDTTVLAR